MDQITRQPIPVQPLEASYAWSDPEDAIQGGAVAAFLVGPEDWYPHVQHGDILTAHVSLAGQNEQPANGELVIMRGRAGDLAAGHWAAGMEGCALVAVVSSITRPIGAGDHGTRAGLPRR